MKTLTSKIFHPELFLLAILGLLAALAIDDRIGMFGFSLGFPNVWCALFVLAVWLSLEVVLFASSWAWKSSRRYSIRWMLMLMVAAAISVVMYQYDEQRTLAMAEIKTLELRLLNENGDWRRIRYDEENEMTLLTYEPINGHEELTEINFLLEETDCGC